MIKHLLTTLKPMIIIEKKNFSSKHFYFLTIRNTAFIIFGLTRTYFEKFIILDIFLKNHYAETNQKDGFRALKKLIRQSDECTC